MAASKKDPTDAIRLKASRYPGVDKGTSCSMPKKLWEKWLEESYQLSLAAGAGKKPAAKKASKKKVGGGFR